MIGKIVEYLEVFPPFRIVQALLNNKILELVGFLMPRDWQR